MSSLPNHGVGLSLRKEDGKSSGDIPCASPKNKGWNYARVWEGPLEFPKACTPGHPVGMALQLPAQGHWPHH